MADEKQESVDVIKEVKENKAEWIEREKIKLEVRHELREEYETLYNHWKTNDLVAVQKDAEVLAQKAITKLFDEWKKDQAPPSNDEIQGLLNQEYETFTIHIESYEEDQQSENFTIRELPQSAEKKFYRQFKSKIIGKASDLQALTQAGLDKPFEERAKAFLDIFDESFDMLAETVVIVLNPTNKKTHITKDWVQNNISSNRQWQIIEAQIKVNRIRDFFSKLSQSGQSTQTMLEGLNFQQLQQLAR